jgi:hypothetical protein
MSASDEDYECKLVEIEEMTTTGDTSVTDHEGTQHEGGCRRVTVCRYSDGSRWRTTEIWWQNASGDWVYWPRKEKLR